MSRSVSEHTDYRYRPTSQVLLKSVSPIFLVASVFIASASFVTSLDRDVESPAITTEMRSCFFVADNDGQVDTRDVLTTLDPTTGVERVLGRTGTDFVEAIAYSPFRSTLYAVDGGDLGSLNLFSGKFSFIGKVGHGTGALGDQTFSDIDGLTVDPATAVLYGSVRKAAGNLLIQINPISGSIVDHAFGITLDYVPIGPLPAGSFIDDLAVNPLDGLLYGVASGANESAIVTIDKVTGAVDHIVDLDVQELEGLTFDGSGTMYGIAGSSNRRVYSIDHATGVATERYRLGVDGNSDYESIDCVTNASLPDPDFAPSDSRAPGDIRIEGAYPVPAQRDVTIRARFTKTLAASLEVYDIRGRRVALIPERVYDAGIHEVDIRVSEFTPGTYNYRWHSRLQDAFGDFVVVR